MTDGIFLLLGSNLGDQIEQLSSARRRLTAHGVRLLQLSEVYRSAAWGPIKQADFANQVVKTDYQGPPEKLLSILLEIEIQMGRVRDEKWGPRIIDIDLLYYDQLALDVPNLTLPHPEIANRRFTLAPMAELAPTFIHPVLKKNQALLLKQCPDNLEVTLWC